MALPSKYGIDKKINSMEGLSAYENGGKGSGNFGHAGRPGERGGSGKGGRPTYLDKMSDSEIKKEMKSLQEDLDEYNRLVEKAESEGLTDKEIEDQYGYEDFTGFGSELADKIDMFRTELQRRGKSPVRKQDEWFVTLKQIDDEYGKRGKEMEDNAGEVESAIYETGETWTGPKQKALDLVKIGIRTNRDTFTDSDEFLEQTRGLFDDLKDVEGFKAKTVDVYEHPMSASGIVIQEHKKK